jgi:7-carboxy-7-deazaguanine synthase (Cx14CxxC type)
VTYAVKEIFYTLQGEGVHAGRPAVFCRFAGCNLWSGREADRASAVCRFCDTQFVGVDGVGGGKFADALSLADAVLSAWSSGQTEHRMVVLTGGEPLLQVDEALIDALHARGFYIAVETNGTVVAPPGLDWLCVSPKGSAPVVQRSGDELKLVYPQAEPQAQPEACADWAFKHFSLQPLDDAERAQHTSAAVAYCMAHPQWHLSMQTHKWLNIP